MMPTLLTVVATAMPTVMKSWHYDNFQFSIWIAPDGCHNAANQAFV